MKKIKLLYDASLISEYYKKNSRRTGVYFVEYNIFNRLINSPYFDIFLYCRPNCIRDLKNTLNSDKYARYGLQIINDDGRICRFLESIWINTEEAARKNRITRIIRNRILRLLNYIDSTRIEKRLSKYSVDAFFSAETIEIPKGVFENKDIYIFVFINDVIPLIFPQYFEGAAKGRVHPVAKAVNQFNERCNRIYGIAISEHSRSDFLRFTPRVTEKNTIVAHLACDESFVRCDDGERIRLVLEKYGIPVNKKYVLSLCTLEPRKNLMRAVDAFIRFIKKNEIHDLYMVLCGSGWDGFIEKIEKSIDDLGDYRDRVIITGYADDADVPVLYSGAEWFVYTSQYEGFGLPPLEAMNCGCPVITSNNSSLPEVVGDAGIMIDYDSIEQHVEAFEKMYYDEEFRKECTQKGLKQAGKFSWDRCCSIIERFILDNIGRQVEVFE